jgi:hypothetical protein
VTFLVEVTQGTGNTAKVLTVPVTIGQTAASQVTKSLKIKGTGLDTTAAPNGVTNEELKSGRIKAMEVSLTVISDAGIEQLRKIPFSDAKRSEFMAKNSYQYSKLVQLPSM